MKACWNSNFRASRGTKFSKFSGALPLDPVGGAYSAPQTPQLFAPSVARLASLDSFPRSNRRLASLDFSWEKSFFHSHAWHPSLQGYRLQISLCFSSEFPNYVNGTDTNRQNWIKKRNFCSFFMII